MQSTNRLFIEGLVLAGGRGSRFGNRNKGLIPLAGKAMVQQVVERLATQIDEITISCNSDLEQYQKILSPLHNQHGQPVVTRFLADREGLKFQGPLAGIAAMMEASSADYIFACPCDTPFVPLDIVERLLTALSIQAGASGEIQRVDASYPMHQNRSQHLVVLFNRLAGLNALKLLVDSQTTMSVKNWLQHLQVNTESYPVGETGFANVNTLKQLKLLENSS